MRASSMPPSSASASHWTIAAVRRAAVSILSSTGASSGGSGDSRMLARVPGGKG